jgi:flagellar biosynthesis protein
MANNKTGDKAVAILYDRQRGDAPQIVASGRGELAARITEKARQAGVHVMQDPVLVELLSHVPVGEEIPVELYQAVAEVLSFVYQLENRYPAAADSEPEERS